MFGYVYCPKGRIFMRSTDRKLSAGDRLYTRGELFCDNYNDSSLCEDCNKGECVLDFSFLEREQYDIGDTVAEN